MEEKPSGAFYARFLGGFSLQFAGKEMLLEVNPQGKTMQMLYFLLKAGSGGCEKKELLELVRPGEKDTKKRMNNFRQQLFRMRELLHQAGFPKGDYIVYQGKRFYFTLDYPLHVDTEKLDHLIEQMRCAAGIRAGTGAGGKTGHRSAGSERGQSPWQQYENYCEAYTGEFLPILGGEEWVALESAYYQKWYFTCLNKLSLRLKEEKKFERLLRLVTAASQIHPYDEWQVVQIECLMALGRRREAEKVYEEANEMFYKDLGLTSLERAMERYSQESQPLPSCSLARTLEKVKEGLDEKEERRGAYYCSYPSFMDIYRIRARMDEANREQSLLLLCTLSAEKGEWQEGESKEQMELFQKTLVQQTRSGDVYTQYSRNQYLVLLSGAGKACEDLMISRLEKNWKKAGGRAKVKFSMDEVEGAKQPECF